MTQEKQHDIALMRYSVISPIINGLSEEYSSLDAFYRDAAKKGTVAPDGTLKHFSTATIERWYRSYKNGGFDALIPQGRVDQGKPRKLDADLQEQINYLKRNYPRMSASAIFRQLHDNGSIITGEVSKSTVNRYVNQLALELKTTTNRDMRRYERPHINEVWCGDSSVGPYLKTAGGKNRFRTMKDQWMASLDIGDFHSLDELRGNLLAYVNAYNNSPHSSLKGKSPQERFFSEPECFHRLPEDELDKNFLLEIERRVSADSVIVIDRVEYEVDCRFAKQRIKLRYSPD